MKLKQFDGTSAFTLAEMMMAVALGALILGATFAASISLQKSFSAVDRYFSAHSQQIRVIDYLGRDVKRSVIVNTSVNQQTVNCTVPNYVIQTGDGDATGSNVGKRRTPTIDFRANAFVVNYGAGKTFTDAIITAGSVTLTSATANFTAGDVGSHIAGTAIPAGTTIATYTNSGSITLSNKATATASGATVTIGIARTFADAVTTSASPTLTSATGAFTARDVGLRIAGNGIPIGATIQAYVNATTITLSANATATATAVTATIGYSNVVYSVTNKTIVRTENGNVTTIASSTDQLIPTTTDVQTANTEYTATAVTFQPTFNFGASNTARAGTTVYSVAYLRNLRRGN
jgi:hypothetical protein